MDISLDNFTSCTVGMETRDVVLVMGPGKEMRDSMMRSTSRFVLITINGKGEGWLGNCYEKFMIGGDYSELDPPGEYYIDRHII